MKPSLPAGSARVALANSPETYRISSSFELSCSVADLVLPCASVDGSCCSSRGESEGKTAISSAEENVVPLVDGRSRSDAGISHPAKRANPSVRVSTFDIQREHDHPRGPLLIFYDAGSPLNSHSLARTCSTRTALSLKQHFLALCYTRAAFKEPRMQQQMPPKPSASLLPDRRSFLAFFSGLGLAPTLFPGVLWAKLEEQKPRSITKEMLRAAAAVAGVQFTEAQLDAMLAGVNENLAKYQTLRKTALDNSVAPPLYFNPIVPGMKIDRTQRAFQMSPPQHVSRPQNLEDVAFLAATHLAELLRSKQVSSV